MRSIIVVFRNAHLHRSPCESRYGLVSVTQLLTFLIRQISWRLSRKSEKDTKTLNRGVTSSVLDLNLTLPNTKEALISSKSHIVWGEVWESFTSARKILRWSGRRDFALVFVWMPYVFFPSVYAVLVIVELFVCIVTCEEVGRWILFKCNTKLPISNHRATVSYGAGNLKISFIIRIVGQHFPDVSGYEKHFGLKYADETSKAHGK